VALVEFGRGQGLGHERSRLAPVGWPGPVGFGIRWLLELDHLKRSTSRYQRGHGDGWSLEQMNDDGGRGVGCVVLARREKTEGMDGKKFCAGKA
jgi:hypothetical protein